MDTSDPDIVFDENGVCNHCHRYDYALGHGVLAEKAGYERLIRMVEAIKKEGRNKPYDCVIGVSGGVDSTFVALKVKELGLRPLAVHLDNGWDSELAVANIHKALNALNIDLHTHVIDWEEFKDLQLSFLKASTPDSEIPSDHAIYALMVTMAWKVGTPYILAGYNHRTESHLPAAWSQGHLDWKYVRSVHARFGRLPLTTFPHITFVDYYRHFATQVRIDILNYVDYRKDDAMRVLEQKLGWKYYGGKHYESIYTRFYQGYMLPRKFGYDKRRTHFSSLVCAGELTREAALLELENSTYPEQLQRDDREYVIKKLGISEPEFERIMALPKKQYWDYPCYGKLMEGKVLWTFRLIRAPFFGLRGTYKLFM